MAARQESTAQDASGVDLGPLPGLVGYALRRAQVAVFQDFYASFASVALRPAEFSVLLVIHRNPGLRQRQIGDALSIKPPNFAVLLGRLVARGLAERRASLTSRRSVALHLTPGGRRCWPRPCNCWTCTSSTASTGWGRRGGWSCWPCCTPWRDCRSS